MSSTVLHGSGRVFTAVIYHTYLWLSQKHISSFNNLIFHSKSIFKGLYVTVKNNFLWGANDCDFYFWKPCCCALCTAIKLGRGKVNVLSCPILCVYKRGLEGHERGSVLHMGLPKAQSPLLSQPIYGYISRTVSLTALWRFTGSLAHSHKCNSPQSARPSSQTDFLLIYRVGSWPMRTVALSHCHNNSSRSDWSELKELQFSRSQLSWYQSGRRWDCLPKLCDNDHGSCGADRTRALIRYTPF